MDDLCLESLWWDVFTDGRPSGYAERAGRLTCARHGLSADSDTAHVRDASGLALKGQALARLKEKHREAGL